MRNTGPARRPLARTSALFLVVLLSGCATPVGGTVLPTPTETLNPTATSTSATPTDAATSTPLPTDAPLPDPVPSAAGTTSVTIVNWNSDGRVLSASGLVTGARDTGGRCTLTATSSTGQILTGEVEAQSTPAAINCGLIDIPAPTGAWQLVLSYRDGETVLSSEPVSVDQP